MKLFVGQVLSGIQVEYVELYLRWRVSLLMVLKSICFFISDSRKVLKFKNWIQLAIVYLHINFQTKKNANFAMLFRIFSLSVQFTKQQQ